MVSYEQLPKENPSKQQAEPGTYYGVILSTEVGISQQTANPRLRVHFSLYDSDGNLRGDFQDYLVEKSISSLPLYKLRRFIDALELDLKGDFTLDELAKLCQGKGLIIDVRKDPNSSIDRLQADIYKGEIYYPFTESNNIFGLSKVPETILKTMEKLQELDFVPLDNNDVPF